MNVGGKHVTFPDFRYYWVTVPMGITGLISRFMTKVGFSLVLRYLVTDQSPDPVLYVLYLNPIEQYGLSFLQ